MSVREQALAHLERANDARARRSRLKRRLKEGIDDPRAVLLSPPWWTSSMTVLALLSSTPYMGEVRSRYLCRRAGVSPEATLGNLTSPRVLSLIRELDARSAR